MHANFASTEMPSESRAVETVEIRVRGTVQGVGFRPTVWRLAQEDRIGGQVLNDGAGVLIQATGRRDRIARFVRRLETNPPPLSRIESIETRRLRDVIAFDGFTIGESLDGEIRTHITADAAVCAACRAEVLDPGERRYRYPFTNCTHCGPRLSIVRGVPYDRRRTTMAAFDMCADCAHEYGDPGDRRFHAQPIACAACGPKVWLENFDGGSDDFGLDPQPLDTAVRLLRDGAILAIRGLGGFHLACDAGNEQVVARLRARKRRFGKPFALMARDIAAIEHFAVVTDQERQLLQSPAAPVVLLQASGSERLPEAIAPGLGTLGFMLPYTPLHLLLLESFDRPLVMTSGNIAHEPQVTDNGEVRAKLGAIADAALLHDRDIANRVDDSVVRVMAGRPRAIRRARGFAPAPMALPGGFCDAPEILAFGGELKSTFCLIKNGAAVLSQHQGDLEDVATFDDYQKNLRLYAETYDHAPSVFAADMHPEYLSTKLAKERAGRGTLHMVQHHHAHVASAMAENGHPLGAPPVIGIVLDGLGYGADGTIWGGEFLLADYREFRRLGCLKPTAMIGGAQAMREPWRNTYAQLVATFGWDGFQKQFGALDLARFLAAKPRAAVDRMLRDGLNVPPASSCGRLFDAVAAALGFCRDAAQFEGQAAMELEDAIDDDALAEARLSGGYPFEATDGEGTWTIEPRPMWRALLEDIGSGISAARASARFHIGLARTVVDVASRMAGSGRGVDTIVLTGGCFQNKILLEACLDRIESRGLKCLTQSQVPSNDGGLSLGQAAVAAAREIAKHEAGTAIAAPDNRRER